MGWIKSAILPVAVALFPLSIWFHAPPQPALLPKGCGVPLCLRTCKLARLLPAWPHPVCYKPHVALPVCPKQSAAFQLQQQERASHINPHFNQL